MLISSREKTILTNYFQQIILPRLLSRVRERLFIPEADNRPGRPLTERN